MFNFFQGFVPILTDKTLFICKQFTFTDVSDDDNCNRVHNDRVYQNKLHRCTSWTIKEQIYFMAQLM